MVDISLTKLRSFLLAIAALALVLAPRGAAAQLQFAPGSFNIIVPEGQDPPPEYLYLYTADGVPSYYTLYPSDQRISVTPDFGSVSEEFDTITVSFVTADLDPGDYHYTITVDNTAAAKGSAQQQVDVFISVRRYDPLVVHHPVPQTLTEDSSTTLFVQATGTQPLSYHWQYSRDCEMFGAATDDAVLSGTTTASLSIIRPTGNYAGCYRCVVTNPVGENASNSAWVDVLTRPSISDQPTSYTLVSLEQPLSLYAGATGTGPLSYRWYFALDCGRFEPLSDGDGVGGSDSSQLTISSVGADNEGCYRCLVTNEFGEVDTELARVEVVHPPLIRAQPQSVAAATTEATGFRIVATGAAPLSYSWERRDSFGIFHVLTDSGRVFGTATSALTIADAAVADSGVYRCVVSNDLGTATSDLAGLTVTDFPAELKVGTSELLTYAAFGTNAPAQTLTVSNPGGRMLEFRAMPEAPWIADVSTEGLVPPGRSAPVRVTYATDSLDLGSYEGTIILAEIGGSGQQVVVPVRLQVVDAFTVTSLLDDGGPGTLRSVIQRANETEGSQTIAFAVQGPIIPQSELPPMSDPDGTIINGQGGIQLSGQGLNGSENGINIISGNNQILGLAITGFPGNGVNITGATATGNLVAGCQIGVQNGQPGGNHGSGIMVADGATSNTLGGGSPGEQNRIAGNSFSGITVENASDNQLLGNLIGIPEGPTAGQNNGGHGIYLVAGASGSLENVLGGPTVQDRNFISGATYFPTTVFAVTGAEVKLTPTVATTDPVDYQWFHDEVAVGDGSAELTISPAEPADTGLYYCKVSNAAGSDKSRLIYLLVASRLQMAIPKLLTDYASLDVNRDGRLALTEVGGLNTKLFAGTARPLASQEDFDALDSNHDGYLSVDELVAGTPLPAAEPTYRVTPDSHTFPEADIDNGVAGTQQFTIENLGATALDLFSTPTLTNSPEEWRYTADSGQRVLAPLDQRLLTVASDPAKLNRRTGYMNVRTDDFLVPVLPVPLVGVGYQTTPELLGTLSQTDQRPRTIGEVDVNEDQVFDAADVRSNTLQSH